MDGWMVCGKRKTVCTLILFFLYNLNGKGGIRPAFGPMFCPTRPLVMIYIKRSACTGHPVYLTPKWRCGAGTKNVTSKLIESSGPSAMTPLKQQ